MNNSAPFFLVGDFNGWKPGDPRYRFENVTSPYGIEAAPHLTLDLGSYCLKTRFPSGRLQFKILGNASWDHQWSIWNSYKDTPYDITKYRFETRHGLPIFSIFYRGDGMPPHSEFDYPGGTMRWDFHPDSLTLAIHSQLKRSPGMTVGFWKTFHCGQDLVFDSWYCLPYGYVPDGSFKYPACLMFDGRGLLYGEEHSQWHQVSNMRERQWPRVMDVLARHGVIAPPVVIAIGVPRHPVANQKMMQRSLRSVAYLECASDLHKTFSESICGSLIPDAEQRFNLSSDPQDWYLLGHSNGGDMALSLLAYRPEAFHGAIAVSPGNPFATKRLAELPQNHRQRLRIALAYTSREPTPGFRTNVAQVRQSLLAAGIPHLVQYFPDATHDPASVYNYLPGCFAFVIS